MQCDYAVYGESLGALLAARAQGHPGQRQALGSGQAVDKAVGRLYIGWWAVGSGNSGHGKAVEGQLRQVSILGSAK